MSVTSTTRKTQYDLTGGLVASYPIPFKYFSQSEIKAILTDSAGVDTALVYGVDYSVSAAGDSGTLTRITTWVGDTLTVYRDTDKTQPTSLANGGGQDAPTYMKMVDRAVAMIQEINETISRIVRTPITDPETVTEMPTAAERAGLVLGFNAIGQPMATPGGAGAVTSTFMATVLDDPDPITAQKTLGLIPSGNAAAIVSALQTILGSATLLAFQKNGGLIPSGAASVIPAGAQDFLTGETIKDFITDTGYTYDSSNVSVLFRRSFDARRFPVGHICDELGEQTVGYSFPAIPLWDSDHTVDSATYPQLVTWLRAQKLKAWNGTGYGSGDFVVNVSAGGVVTFTGPEATNALAMLAEDELVRGSYTNWRSLTWNGTEYAITAVTPGSMQCTVSGWPSAQTGITVSFYTNRIVGSATTARTFKDSGRALMSQDGINIVAGLMRRNRFQGHRMGTLSGSFGINNGSTDVPGGGTRPRNDSISSTTGDPVTDGTNGTPRVGPDTEPNSTGIFRYLWAGIKAA